MTDSPASFNPARALATQVLAQVLSGEGFAAPALDRALSRNKALSSRDAGLATHIVYGTLRHHFTLEAALSPLLRANTHVRVRALLLAGAFEKLVLGTPAHAVVNEYVNLARRDFGKVSSLTNAVLRKVSLPPASPETEFNLPAWLIEEFEGAYGELAERVMRDFLQPAPLWLWLTDDGIRLLEDEGALVEPGHGDVFRVSLAASLRSSRAFVEGQAQPINPSSYAAVEALGEVAGARVLDLAGGAGVKAAMLAARGGQVESFDIDARKHLAARKNLARLHLSAEFHEADLRFSPATAPAPLVLLDAPCTGSGTLRSHPEIKLRLTPGVVGEMAALQGQLLESAAALVEQGGTLVYSVCSIAAAEGPEVVRRFLQGHPHFEPRGAHLSVPAVQDDFGLRTTATEGRDGFYIARLRHMG